MLGQEFAGVLAAARTGAEWAWTMIYRDLSPPVLGYFRARGAPDPEDLAGEVFVQVVRDVRNFQGDESAFRAWVFTIAHHRLLDHHRGSLRRPSTPVAEMDSRFEGQTEDAAGHALRGIETERVRRIISTLSPDQQTVLLLRILGGLTIDEIATATGKRPGAVKALQRRGLAALRREISKKAVPL